MYSRDPHSSVQKLVERCLPSAFVRLTPVFMALQSVSTFSYGGFSIVIPNDLHQHQTRLLSLQQDLFDACEPPSKGSLNWKGRIPQSNLVVAAVLAWQDQTALTIFWGPHLPRDKLADWLYPMSLVEQNGLVVAGTGWIHNTALAVHPFVEKHPYHDIKTRYENICQRKLPLPPRRSLEAANIQTSAPGDGVEGNQ
ncbi:hypothetical protein T440DRAFT_484111 [Plenodomus tracheiphilus IPT5]|uniref:Uncharacterized protein n=1 Tax=Plenodomus tracheiphilus IPT5 TaxID=1408161 RepID=A0A6A7AN68_9PLEO|nr:hypothetical protein T440DRAFT_484111 [Plenodomus tracheiphilus IPT5]